MTKFIIDEVVPKGSIYPLLCSYENGYINDDFHRMKCYLYYDVFNDNKLKILNTVNDILYVGEEEKQDLGKTFILARNRTTGKVRVIDTGRCELKPALENESEAPELAETSLVVLNRKFGSKKSTKKTEQKEKLKTNVDTMNNQMQNITETITEDKFDTSLYLKTNSEDSYIPPINKLAKNPQDVYDILTILTKDQYEKIYSELENKDYKSEMLPFIRALISNPTSTELVLAMYANSLLKLYLSVSKNILKKDFAVCTTSVSLNTIVLDNFTHIMNKRRTRPNTHKDKALCHALVFVLLINNFKFEIATLAETINLAPATVMTKARIVGAQTVTHGDKKYMQLKTPINTNTGIRRKSAKF